MSTTPVTPAPAAALPDWWELTLPLTPAMFANNPGKFVNGSVSAAVPGAAIITTAGAQALAALFSAYVVKIQDGPLTAETPNADMTFTYSQEPYFVYSNGTWGPVSDIWQAFIHGWSTPLAVMIGLWGIQEDMASGEMPPAA